MKRILTLVVIAPLSVLALSCKKAPPPAAAPAPKTAAVPGAAPAGTAAGTPAAIKPMPAQIPAVLARVNGEAIERWEFDNALKYFLR